MIYALVSIIIWGILIYFGLFFFGWSGTLQPETIFGLSGFMIIIFGFIFMDMSKSKKDQ